MRTTASVGAVVIGRNEGARLALCLQSLVPVVGRIVYVDSGSTDDSVAQAEAIGAQVVALDVAKPFTAGRARNAGFERLMQAGNGPEFVQFIDGDCELNPHWINTASNFLYNHSNAAIVCGRLRERYPERSIYNRLADAEWDSPVGEVLACGGIMMMRTRAFGEADGFDARLIAGEEPELCVRLRLVGWTIWHLAAEMAWHDIAMTRFGQWWRRSRRTGHTYAEGVVMHGAFPERHYVTQMCRALIFGGGIPIIAALGSIFSTPWALTILMLWPAQMALLFLRGKPWEQAVFLTLGKVPEALGMLSYGWRRLIGSRAMLIEYK